MGSITVGISGGVDSAVAAFLLQREGWRVEGVFIRTWHPPSLTCTQDIDRLEAIRTAVSLGIPLRTVDTGDAYRKGVFEPMMRAFQEGLTPNPDVWCNPAVKFPALLQAEGECVATGHYARVVEGADGYPALARGRDPKKDQSYFLAALPRNVFARVRFPLGNLTKDEVRAIARDAHLPPATRRDSTGLCFLGPHTLRDVLASYMPLTPGPIISLTGVEVGTHEGLPLYTIGQRQGLAIQPKSADAAPWYVVAKVPAFNALIVSHQRSDSATMVVPLANPVWHMAPESRIAPVKMVARYRHGGELVGVTIEYKEGRWWARFDVPQQAVAPGQWLVGYDREGRVVMAAPVAFYFPPAVLKAPVGAMYALNAENIVG